MGLVSDLLIVAGAALAMIGGIGAVRFRDLYSRMHAAAKSPTLGLVLVSIGAAIAIDSTLAYTTLLLVVILQLLSSPVGAHALSRASHRQTPVALDGPDHLARDEAAPDQPQPRLREDSGDPSRPECHANVVVDRDADQV